MADKIVLKERSELRMRFQPGTTGPAGTIAVGTVTTGAPGSSVIITNTGTANASILNFTIPRGDTGLTGDKGWSPILAIVTDGVRRVVQVADWTGGQGTKPATGSYIGATGLVSDIASAIDIRGPQGPSGSVTDGDKGDVIVSSSGTVWTLDATGTLAGYAAKAGTNAFTGTNTFSSRPTFNGNTPWDTGNLPDPGWKVFNITRISAGGTAVVAVAIPAGAHAIRLEGMILQGTNTNLVTRFSVDGGTTYKSGSSDYAQSFLYHDGTTVAGGAGASVSYLTVSLNGTVSSVRERVLDVRFTVGSASQVMAVQSITTGVSTDMSAAIYHGYGNFLGPMTNIQILNVDGSAFGVGSSFTFSYL